jgi:hypothetical protein
MVGTSRRDHHAFPEIQRHAYLSGPLMQQVGGSLDCLICSCKCHVVEVSENDVNPWECPAFLQDGMQS